MGNILFDNSELLIATNKKNKRFKNMLERKKYFLFIFIFSLLFKYAEIKKNTLTKKTTKKLTGLRIAPPVVRLLILLKPLKINVKLLENNKIGIINKNIVLEINFLGLNSYKKNSTNIKFEEWIKIDNNNKKIDFLFFFE